MHRIDYTTQKACPRNSLWGPASHSSQQVAESVEWGGRWCPPSPEQFCSGSFRLPEGELWPVGRGVYHTFCLMLFGLRCSLLKHKSWHSILKTRPRVLAKYTSSGITPVSRWAISLLPNAFITTFLIKESWAQKRQYTLQNHLVS